VTDEHVLIVAEGDGVFDDAVAELRAGGARIVEGWAQPRPGIVCAGAVASAADAEAVVLAAVAGGGVVVDAHADREVVDRLCSDLRAIGALDHRLERSTRGPQLTREQRELLTLLGGGASLGEAARRLHLSRRTADRRLAAARATLGTSTTAETLAAFARET
jgi:DNA-binding NarL/FixJ family response regulator